MRILVDTNVLFSSFLFPGSTPDKALSLVIDKHSLVIADQTIEELHEILERKAPSHMRSLLRFIELVPFELIHWKGDAEIMIRDLTDAPILGAAVEHDVDLILTGDKDFLALNLRKPRCINSKSFLAEYGEDI